MLHLVPSTNRYQFAAMNQYQYVPGQSNIWINRMKHSLLTAHRNRVPLLGFDANLPNLLFKCIVRFRTWNCITTEDGHTILGLEEDRQYAIQQLNNCLIQINNLNNTILTQQTKINTLQSQNTTQLTTIGTLQNEKNDLINQKQQLTNANTKLRETNQQLQSAKESVEKELNEQKTIYADLIAKAEEKLQRAEKSLLEERKKAAKAFRKLKKTITEQFSTRNINRDSLVGTLPIEESRVNSEELFATSVPAAPITDASLTDTTGINEPPLTGTIECKEEEEEQEEKK